MNTTLLQQMGLGGLDLGYLVIAVGVAIVLLLVVMIFHLISIQIVVKDVLFIMQFQMEELYLSVQ